MSEQQPFFNIDRIYLKDLSLEIPNAPQVYAEREAPNFDISLRNEARPLDGGVFEVVLTATVTAKVNDKTAFLVEVAQAGIFQVRNVPQQELEAILGVTCGNILFPYLRENISSVVVRGGFPPFLLNHLSFEALFQQQRQQQRQADTAAPPTA